MIRKNRYPSKLWQYFVRGEDTAKCNLCKKVFSFKSSLSNLKKHLIRKHPTVEILRDTNTTASNKILLTEENLNDISQISFKKIRLTGRSENTEPGTSASGVKLNSANNRKRTSIVWKYFSDDNGVVTCNLCKNIFTYNTSSSSNLKKHLFRKHPIVNTVEATDIVENDEFGVVEENSDNVNVENIIDIDQEMTVFYPSENVNTDASCNQEKVSKFMGRKVSPSAKKIEDLLLDLFILDFQPFSIVEDRGFRKLMKVVSPMYTLPTRKVITKTLLPTKYEECFSKIKKELSDVKLSSVILTIDSWTSMNTESFMAVTCHFINSNFLLESRLLECFSFSQSSTSSDLAGVLERIANDWGLENKISFCISDGSSNVKTAVKDILKWNQLDCYGRTINSIANDGLELSNISSVIRKIKSVIQHFKMCADSAKMLSDFQENLGSTPKKLLSDVSQVWNSTFYMLERFVELEEPICSVLAQIDKDLPVLDSKEWKIAAELVEVLQPLEEITKIMSEEVYLTASSVIIMTKGMESAYVEMLDNSLLPETQEVVESITLGIRCHLGDLETSDSLLITTFLDPRFKTVGFSSPSTAEKAKKLVIDILTKPEFRLMESNEKQKETTTSGDEKVVRKRHSAVWNLFDKQAAEFKPAVINNSGAVIEVQRYLEEPLLSRNEDPIKWWQENSYNYPILKTFFIEKFVALATSVPCERLFSKTGVIFSDRRSRLSSDSVKKLVFLNANQQ